MVREALRQQSAILKAVVNQDNDSHPLRNHLVFALQQQGLSPEVLFTLPGDVVNRVAVSDLIKKIKNHSYQRIKLDVDKFLPESQRKIVSMLKNLLLKQIGARFP